MNENNSNNSNNGNELVKKVEQIINQYGQECMGNRVNQFSMLSLKELILNTIKEYMAKEGQKNDKTVSK
jgi:hypothetical protein